MTAAPERAYAHDREARLRDLADKAWDAKSRVMFDAVILLARQMGRTDGTREVRALLDKMFKDHRS